MPLYEFYCPSCRKKFDAFRPMSESSVAVACPQCESRSQRVFSVIASFGMTSDGSVSAIAGAGGGCSG